MTDSRMGAWINPDGSLRELALKGSLFYDSLRWTEDAARGREGLLHNSREDMARAYALAVWAYRCVRLRADAVAGVALKLLDASGAPLDKHPLLSLLSDVNPKTMNLGDLLRATESALCIWGVSYWLKVTPPGINRPRQLVWLNPATIEPKTDPRKGVIVYEQRIGAERRAALDANHLPAKRAGPQRAAGRGQAGDLRGAGGAPGAGRRVGIHDLRHGARAEGQFLRRHDPSRAGGDRRDDELVAAAPLS